MDTEKQHKAECPRCLGGKGHIDAFIHVLGGVCFKCKGKGYVILKSKPRRSLPWHIGATNLEQSHPGDHPVGAVVFPIFTIRARSESEALRKAKAQLSRGTAYDAETAFVKPV